MWSDFDGAAPEGGIVLPGRSEGVADDDAGGEVGEEEEWFHRTLDTIHRSAYIRKYADGRMDKTSVIKRLQRLVDEHGSQKEAASSIGIKPSYFNDVLQGRREPGPKILGALGLRKGYERA